MLLCYYERVFYRELINKKKTKIAREAPKRMPQTLGVTKPVV